MPKPPLSQSKYRQPRVSTATEMPLLRAARIFDKIVTIFGAHDAATAQDIILEILCYVGFKSARLYYLDPNNRLVLENKYGKQPRCKKSLRGFALPVRDLHPPSYAAIDLKRPLVVRVNSSVPESLTPQELADGVLHINIHHDPLRASYEVPPTREWIDFPLLALADKRTQDKTDSPSKESKVYCFGKITLEHPRKSIAITRVHCEILRMLLEPISRAISYCGWFAGAAVPLDIRAAHTSFPIEAQLEDLLDSFLAYVKRTFNAHNCSVFWALRPKVPNPDTITQTEKLVLWRTTFKDLKPMHLKGFYVKNQGLTGRVWAEGKPLFIADLVKYSNKGPHKGHLDDSRIHTSYVASPIYSSNENVVGVIRIPHGKRSLHPRDCAILQYFAKTVVGPSIERHIDLYLSRTYRRLMDIFAEHLSSLSLDQPLAMPPSLGNRDREISNVTRMWEFIIKCGFDVFGPGRKKFVAYAINQDSFHIVKCAGHLPVSKRFQRTHEFSHTRHSAAQYVLEQREAVLFTDLQSAEEQGVYFPLIEGASSAMLAPLNNGHDAFGIIAVVSSVYDLLPNRDLPILTVIARLAETLQRMSSIILDATASERHRSVELAAYQTKLPATMLRSYVDSLRQSLAGSAGEVRDLLGNVSCWSDWLYYLAERVVCNIADYHPPVRREMVTLEKCTERLRNSCCSWLEMTCTKRVGLEFRFQNVIGRELFMDENHITTAVLSLVENGVKAARRGSNVIVSASVEWKEYFRYPAQECFALTVRNEGKGCPRGFLDQLKRPGFRIPFEVGPDYPIGTGMGLALTDHIVTEHNGHLHLDSDGKSFFEAEIAIPMNIGRQDL